MRYSISVSNIVVWEVLFSSRSGHSVLFPTLFLLNMSTQFYYKSTSLRSNEVIPKTQNPQVGIRAPRDKT